MAMLLFFTGLVRSGKLIKRIPLKRAFEYFRSSVKITQ